MTAAVAWLALGVSLLSLTWQVVSWQRSGARARPACGTTIERLGTRPEQHLLYVSVTNQGRLATSVQELGFALPDKQLPDGCVHSSYNIDVDKTLPTRLEPGGQLRLTCEWQDIDRWLDGAGCPPDVPLRPYALIGGRMTYGKPLRTGRVRAGFEHARHAREARPGEQGRMIG
ncbi:hypothetical protein [Actinophytocola sp. NPDC049390]|uniref:hypothetical protein n=1 Tax=Actinophytocola sp. NPDC049390 TaxID=3363894 RepID=UPI0037890DE1